MRTITGTIGTEGFIAEVKPNEKLSGYSWSFGLINAYGIIESFYSFATEDMAEFRLMQMLEGLNATVNVAPK